MKTRSIVDSFPVAGSTHVPKSGGVIRQAFCCCSRASIIERPALFALAFDSQAPWWLLKSPPVTNMLLELMRFTISSVSQSPFGTYAEMKLQGVLLEQITWTPIASTEFVSFRFRGKNCRDL